MGEQIRHSDLSAASVTSSIGPHPLVLMEDGTGLNKVKPKRKGKIVRGTSADYPVTGALVCSDPMV